MKKVFVAITCSIFLFSSIFSQNTGKNIVKVTPITITKGQLFMAHYERNIFKSLTLGIGIAPIMWGPLVGSLAFPADKFNTGVAIDPEIRWYAKSDKVMDGFFVGFYNSNRFSSWHSFASTLSMDPVDLNVTNRKTIVGIQVGTERLMGEHFVVDFYTGLGFNANKTVAKDVITNNVYDEIQSGGVNFRLNLALGWRF